MAARAVAEAYSQGAVRLREGGEVQLAATFLALASEGDRGIEMGLAHLCLMSLLCRGVESTGRDGGDLLSRGVGLIEDSPESVRGGLHTPDRDVRNADGMKGSDEVLHSPFTGKGGDDRRRIRCGGDPVCLPSQHLVHAEPSRHAPAADISLEKLRECAAE